MTNRMIPEAQQGALRALQLNSRLTIPEVAEKTGLSLHAAQYAVSQLKERGLFRPFAFLNQHTLGLTDYCLFFNPIGHSSALSHEVVSVLRDYPSVAYSVELVGEFMFSASCFGTDIRVVDELFARLRERLPSIVWRKQFAIRMEWSIFEIGYLGDVSGEGPITRSVHCDRVEIDDKDEALLTALSSSPDLPYARVSFDIGLPKATAKVRIDRLKEKGLLLGFPLYLDTEALGRRSVRIILSVLNRNQEKDAQFRNFGNEHPLISDFVVCVGDWDYEFNVHVANSEELRACINSLQSKFPKEIVQVRTMTLMEVQKMHQFNLSNTET